MDSNRLNVRNDKMKKDGELLPGFEAPKIVTYTRDDILTEIGPARAGSFANEFEIDPA